MTLRRTLSTVAVTVAMCLVSYGPVSAASPRADSDALVKDSLGVMNLRPGYQYTEVVRWDDWYDWGLKRGVDLHKPDLNLYIPLPARLPNGTTGYLFTNHEMGSGKGSVTRVSLDAGYHMIGEPEIILSHLNKPCSGNLTPWGTILVGEEVSDGQVWEIDPFAGTAHPVPGLGRYAHETAVVDPQTGAVWSTEDGYDPASGRGMIYKFVPDHYGDLSSGQLFALDAANRRMVPIADPATAPLEAQAQGLVPFMKPEDAEFGHDGKLYVAVTETDQDGVHWGRVISIHPVSLQVEDFVAGSPDGLNMPDNLTFDRTGNLYIVEDSHSTNQVWVAQPSGKFRPFAEVVSGQVTGPWFTPDYKAMFLNLQGTHHSTVLITGF